MMNKELCFKIDNIDIYLEQVLVDYMDIPIFFLCKGGKQYFIALCTDIDELNYIVVKLPMLDTYNLLHGKIAMQDVILKQNEYWNIISGEDIHLDRITKMSIDTLDKNLLPEKNAYFKILTKQIDIFVKQFDSEFLAKEHFCESDKRADLRDWNVELQLDTLAKKIKYFTELVDYRIEKSLVHKILSYEEKMNPIKTGGIAIKEPKQELMKDGFKLSDSSRNIMADAA